MDPATIVGLVSSCLSLATTIGSTIKGLNDLRNKYKAVEQSTVSLISQVNIVRSSVDLLAQWLQNSSRRKLPPESENSLKSAIDCCAAVIDGISKHVSYAKEQPDEAATFKDKFLQVWNENTINDHVRRLDSQIGSISLWLQVSRLYVNLQISLSTDPIHELILPFLRLVRIPNRWLQSYRRRQAFISFKLLETTQHHIHKSPSALAKIG